jgi:hypothetical protein
VYRHTGVISVYKPYRSMIGESGFFDFDVESGVKYFYRITAVDNDGHESVLSNEQTATKASFDSGILIVDETADERNITLPQAEQLAWFDSLFQSINYNLTTVDSIRGPLHRSEAAPYSSIIWFDDDLSYHLAGYSTDTLRWYLAHGTNMMFAGWRSLYTWAVYQTINPGHILYDEFGLTGYNMNIVSDFIGAKGQNGWPPVVIDPDRIEAKLGYVPSLTYLPGAEVIYTADCYSDRPDFEDQPCAIAWDGPSGKRIFITFPLSALTMESAQALIQHAVAYLGEGNPTAMSGDINHNGRVDLGDITSLIDLVYVAPRDFGNRDIADVDASCKVNLGDIIYLINYVYLGGPEPLPGCAE